MEQVSNPILRHNLVKLNIRTLYDLQSAFCQGLKSGLDLIVVTFPGSGKTISYIIGGLDMIMCSAAKCEQALSLFAGDKHLIIPIEKICARGKEGNLIAPKMIIFSPTQQLAQEIYDHVASCCDQSTTVPGLMYGSVKGGRKIRLGERCDVLVTCPGIFLKLMNLGVIDMAICRHLVLDEYAEMIASPKLEVQIKNALMSAGAGCHLHRDGQEIQVVIIGTTLDNAWRASAEEWIRPGAHERQELQMFSHERDFKNYTLFTIHGGFYAECARCIVENCPQKALIFTLTKAAAFELRDILEGMSSRPVLITNSKLSQAERDAASTILRTKKNVLVISCGDLAQGVNIPDLKTVVLVEIAMNRRNKMVGEMSRTGRLGDDGHVILMEGPDSAAQERFTRLGDFLAGAKIQYNRMTWAAHATGTSLSRAETHQTHAIDTNSSSQYSSPAPKASTILPPSKKAEGLVNRHSSSSRSRLSQFKDPAPFAKEVSRPLSLVAATTVSNVTSTPKSNVASSTKNIKPLPKAQLKYNKCPPPASLRTSGTPTFPTGSARPMQNNSTSLRHTTLQNDLAAKAGEAGQFTKEAESGDTWTILP